MARTPIYPDIPVPHDLTSTIEAVKALKQAVEALTGSTAQANGGKFAPADTGAVPHVWITRADNPGAPNPVGLIEGDMWFIVPNPTDPWIKLLWYQGGWVNAT